VLIRSFIIIFLTLALALSAKANVIVTNGLTHIHTLQEGMVESGYIGLENPTDKIQRVRIYINDYSHNCKGESLFDAPGVNNRTNSNWLKLGVTEVVIPPNTKNRVNYSVNVPDSEEFDGTYWSVIFVEVVDDLDTANLMQNFSVRTKIRYAIQIITNIGEGEGLLKFTEIDYQKETNQVRLHVTNEGSRLQKPEIKIQVYDNNDDLVTEVEARAQKIYPGYCKQYVVPLELEKGKVYKGVVIADSGGEDVFGLNVSFDTTQK